MANLAARLAETVSKLGVKSSYGDPVEVNGVTVIPVALVQFGFGGGSDAGEGESDAVAGGGGGGGMSIPFGAYVRDINGFRFEPNLITLVAVSIPFVWLAGRAGARLIKALKR
ncbi:hypothetical protein OSC27_07745 [Microbacterium sp. STN6]|uniref:spore germination protein GerW family protein n=1 Tax=Microbacterium sp. STN6 TaxID=2995588 RepID=UPI002260D0C8|nr:spore germination protein GerW family protein [Microbacterium sp. STN6]MCX7522171.1 hypothetical protein [Microbacterium sp. STN6]